MQSFDSQNLSHKRVLFRQDFNVPLKDGKVANDARLLAAVPSIKAALAKNASVIILSHLGRPKCEADKTQLTLAPVAHRLAGILKHPVRFIDHWIDGFNVGQNEVILCENVRFLKGEMDNNLVLAKKMAALGDIFVMDAFSVSHRVQASTVGIAQFAPTKYLGPLMQKELAAIEQATQAQLSPALAIVGGAKVSTKLKLLTKLADKVNALIVGGGIANTFLAASHVNIGQSLYEPDLLDTAKALMEKVAIPLPVDVVVAKKMTDNAPVRIIPVSALEADDAIFDIGPETINIYKKLIHNANTIIYNGPVGVFEIPSFANGTQAITQAIAANKHFTLAGGGDTVLAIETFSSVNQFSTVSTGGGAFLQALSGEPLPAVEAILN